jgi:hypothetical protein
VTSGDDRMAVSGTQRASVIAEMAVLALNLMHDIAPTTRRVRRAPIVPWMSVALDHDRRTTSLNHLGSDNDVLGHGLPTSTQRGPRRESARPA